MCFTLLELGTPFNYIFIEAFLFISIYVAPSGPADVWLTASPHHPVSKQRQECAPFVLNHEWVVVLVVD